MLRELEKNVVRKGLVEYDVNWEAITRDDIYRQRVLGTKSGKDDFIKLDDKRKLGCLSLLLYCIFIVACMSYTLSRISVDAGFQVNSAIEGALRRAAYRYGPRPKRWDDIRHVDDLRSWLLYAFPSVLVPSVQRFNFPVNDVRFTLRRMSETENDDERFKPLVPRVWRDKNGISPDDASPSSDNATSFGTYRVWRGQAPQNTAAAGLQWCAAAERGCRGGELLDRLEPKAATRAAVVQRCQQRCEALTADSKPCRCWTLTSQKKCEFYFVPEADLQAPTEQVDGGCPLDSRMPKLSRSKRHTEAHWPRMKRFEFQDSQGGWRSTPGFVVTLPYWTQDEMASMGQSGDVVVPTQAKVLQRQLQDWFDGGLLSAGMTALVVDFVTYNPNYQVYTWCQLTFRTAASGHVRASHELSSLRITQEDLGASSVDMLSDLEGWDVIYFALVCVLILLEIIELGKRGLSYFSQPWSWLTILSLVLHVGTLIARSVYLNNTAFTHKLVDARQQAFGSAVVEFQTQYMAYSDYVHISALNLLFLWVKLVHYLSDIFPRVSLLTRAVYHAMSQIAFLAMIVANLMLGFVIWAHLMFGKTVGEFSSFGSSLNACTELLFGQVGPFVALRGPFPFAGSVFFIIHVVVFLLTMQNVSKAIVLVSFDDACFFRERERKGKSDKTLAVEKDSNNFASRSYRKANKNISDWWTGLLKSSTPHPLQRTTKTYERSPASICLFAAFMLMYMLMTGLMMQVGWAHDLAASVTSAIKSPRFSKVDSVAGQTSFGNDFNTIATAEDVSLFLSTSLPAAMFNSSEGTFAGAANPLKTYHSALPNEEFTQLVIKDWNLLVGQQPVRITTRYSRMDPVGPARALGGILPRDARLAARTPGPTRIGGLATAFDPPLAEAAAPAEILDAKARSVVEKYCSYEFAYASSSRTEDPNGFSCMLSVDYNKTMSILTDMARNNFVNNQTAVIVADFVTYNAFAEAFVYVAVAFQFQPSGAITKGINTFTVRLNLYGSQYWYRVTLEIFVILITHYYLGVSLRGVYKAIGDQVQCNREEAGDRNALQKCLSLLRAIMQHLFSEPFNFLTLANCLMTLIMMGLWFDAVFSKLSQTYFFAERPTWEPARCAASEWCGDDEVIFAFYNQGLKLRSFARVCAINTVLVFLRLLEYTQMYPRMRTMLRALQRASPDLAWVMLVSAALLAGFACLAHELFGKDVHGFSSLPKGMLTCVQLFLGTSSYTEMQPGEATGWFFLFAYSYLVVFRYVMINMFLAVIDRHFKQEQAALEEGLKVQNVSGAQEPPMLTRMVAYAKSLVGGGGSQSTELQIATPTEDRLVEDIGAQRFAAAMVDDSTDIAGALAASGGREEDEEPLADRMSEGTVLKSKNWKYLPPEITEWAVETSKEVCKVIETHQAHRKKVHNNKAALEDVLDRAEEDVRSQRKLKANTAQEQWEKLQTCELVRLKEIHQDQESLAWYIMKREAELKKLETVKASKQERHDKLLQTVTSLREEQDLTALPLEDQQASSPR